MARKHIDQNGYMVLEANPISMVGVFPYTGEQIDFDGSFGLDKKRIYYVLRPEEELFSPEAMKSFDGMPLTIGHEMLGKGFKAVDRKNHEGCIYNVRPSMDMPGYLLADFTIYTDRAKKAIENGTKQLSLGYRCQYERRNGEYAGQPYEFVQTNLRGNHIALVPQGRCGSSVCVCDQALVITCDSLPEEIQMNSKDKKDTDKYEKLAQAVANGSDADCEDCLDFFDLTPEQRKEALAFAKGKKKEDAAPVADAKPKCKDELPPAPEAVVEAEETEEKDDGEVKGEAAGVAVATPEGEAAEVESETETADGCCGKKGKGKKAEDACGKDCGGKAAKDEAPAGMVTEPNTPSAAIPLKKGAKADADDGEACENCKDDNPADGKCDNCGKPVEEHDDAAKAADAADKGTKPHTDKDGKCEEGCNVQCDGGKTFTKAEMDEAIKKAKAEGRKDGLKAKELADAVSRIKGVGAVSCDEMTEVEVARYAAKRIPELAFAQDAADEVVLGAVKGHLAALKGRRAEDRPARVFSVAKDSAIAKTQSVCTTEALSKFLAS